MEHDLELIIPRPEILEIEVCNILYHPGNIGKRVFLTQSYPGNIGKRIFSNFLISWKYWKSDVSAFLISWKYLILDSSIFLYPGNACGGRAEAGGRLWIIFGSCS